MYQFQLKLDGRHYSQVSITVKCSTNSRFFTLFYITEHTTNYSSCQLSSSPLSSSVVSYRIVSYYNVFISQQWVTKR